jgi:hypothetical protein
VNVESTPGVGTTFTLRFPFSGKPAMPEGDSQIRAQASNR